MQLMVCWLFVLQGRDAKRNKKWKYKTPPDFTVFPAYTSDTK